MSFTHKERRELEQDELREAEYWLGNTEQVDEQCNHCNCFGLSLDVRLDILTCNHCGNTVENNNGF